MGVLGAFQVNAFENDAFQVNDFVADFAESSPPKVPKTTFAWQQDSTLGLPPVAVSVKPWGFEPELPRPRRFVLTIPHLDLVLPPLIFPPWGHEPELPRPYRFAPTAPHLDLVLPPLIFPPWGHEPELPRPYRFAPTVPHIDLVLPPLIFPPWNFEPEPPRQYRFVPTTPHLDLVLPPLIFPPWGHEPELPRPYRFVPTAPPLDPALPELAIYPWGFEPELPRPYRFVPTAPHLDLVLPPLIFSSWGFEEELPLPYRFVPTAPPLDLVMLPVPLRPWGYVPELPRPRRSVASPVILDLVMPPIPRAISPWVQDADVPLLAKIARIMAQADPGLPAVLYGAWGFEDVEQGSNRRSVRRAALEDVFPHVIVPPHLVPWGYETISLPARWRPGLAFEDFLALPQVIVGPSPVPNLPREVYIDGGWYNPDIPRVEIVDGPTPAQLQAYLDDLWDEDEEEYERIEPDFVFGKEEYEREKARRRGGRFDPAAPTRFSFDPCLDNISRHRTIMLATDASLHGVPLTQVDAFPLRYRLNIFEPSYERLMRGGTMVRLMPRDPAAILHLARLARLHRYRLVLWTPTSIYLFDKTTLRSKVPGVVWMALGAGMAFWLGSDLGSHTLESQTLGSRFLLDVPPGASRPRSGGPRPGELSRGVTGKGKKRK